MENQNSGQKPPRERLAALRSLPKDVLNTLTQNEINAFLHNEVWPDSLQDKLKRYMVEEDQEQP